MCKKIILIALTLMLVGILALDWVMAQKKKEKLLQNKQQEMAKIDNTRLNKIEKFVRGQIDSHSFAHDIPDKPLQPLATIPKIQRQITSLAYVFSIICIAAGGSVVIFRLLLITARFLIKIVCNITGVVIIVFNRLKFKYKRSAKQDSQTLSSMQDTNEDSFYNQYSEDDEQIDMLFTDEQIPQPDESLLPFNKNADLNTEPFDQLTQNISKTIASDKEDVLKLENSLKSQTESLGKQVAEFKQMTKTVKQTTLEQSKPINTTLEELTQQVSAIREYASLQQNRIQKLQEGYDWNIIRNFCLRIIRCIDNLENRIRLLAKQNIDTNDLEEIRDDFLFALESSGIEQFEPKVNSNYREQEKYAEALKEKEITESDNLKGKIAKVVRQGYRYVIDEENIKVVRTAQVKIFG